MTKQEILDKTTASLTRFPGYKLRGSYIGYVNDGKPVVELHLSAVNPTVLDAICDELDADWEGIEALGTHWYPEPTVTVRFLGTPWNGNVV